LFETDLIPDRFSQFFKHGLMPYQHGFDRVQVLPDRCEVFARLCQLRDELRLSLQQDCYSCTEVPITVSCSRRHFFSYSTVGFPRYRKAKGNQRCKPRTASRLQRTYSNVDVQLSAATDNSAKAATIQSLLSVQQRFFNPGLDLLWKVMQRNTATR
jgi:hypothetical protein